MSKPTSSMIDLGRRLGKVRVLVVDRDARTASLVTAVLRAFGFTRMEVATSGPAVMETMQKKPFDLIITEWHLAQMNGIALVKSLRGAAGHRVLRRDVPIIMLTAQSDMDAVRGARDAGITEFLAKPFSAKTLAARLVQVIDNPRNFIDAPGYVGPCRRRRGEPPADEERRGRKKSHDMLPPNRTLAELIGADFKAAQLFTEQLILQAQQELQQQEAAFVAWANDDIHTLEHAFAQLQANAHDQGARERMTQAAYSIKSQAGMFGYELGTQVAGSLVDYLANHPRLSADNLTVLRKHIDTVAVIFHHKIKESGQQIGVELMDSLQKLVAKLG